MINPKRREMFADLYRLAEYYENPPFVAGDPVTNSQWFAKAMSEVLQPFFDKYHGDIMAFELALDIVDDANRRAVAINKQDCVLR